MTVCEMQEAQDRARRDHEAARVEFEKKLAKLKTEKAKLSPDVLNTDPNTPWDIGLGRLYCNALTLVLPKKAKAQGASPPPRRVGLPQTATSTPRTGPRGPTWEGYATPSGQANGGASSSTNARTASSTVAGNQGPTPQVQPPPPNIAEIAMVENLRLRLQDSSQLMNSYGVEIHKKFALAVACFVFVLLGAPIALRFPRGGVGLTIGVSLFVFALYYVALIGGQTLAQRGFVPPAISMWIADVLFGAVGIWMLVRIGAEGSTSRGGDAREM